MKKTTKINQNIFSKQIVYGLWCNEDGYVIDDGTIFCFDEENFKICCAEKNLLWFEDSAIGFDVEINNITKNIEYIFKKFKVKIYYYLYNKNG